MSRNSFQPACAAAVLIAAVTMPTLGAPIVEPWGGASGADAVAAAQLSGWYATSDTQSDTIEIRDVRETLMRSISRSEISVLAPWMTLDSSDDGPRALAWTDSGRSLFIVVTDDAPSGDGLGSDTILRYDTTTGSLSLFARANIGDAGAGAPSAMHHRGELWVSTQDGNIRVYDARRNDTVGSFVSSWSLPNGEQAHGMALNREEGSAFVVTDSMLYRVDLASSTPNPAEVGPVTRGRGVAYSDHYGAIWNQGAYITQGAGEEAEAGVLFVPRFQASGFLPYAPSAYTVSSDDLGPICATPCGGMLIATESGAVAMRDDEDTKLDYESWLTDEFTQVVTFAQGLIAPDGEPSGWVTDADVASGGSRFHPPSPDGAAWVVLLHIVKDAIDGTDESAPIVRDILERYAGHKPDGIAPRVTSDGIMHHWYDPATGNAAPGWSDEYATLSTMLIAAAADRARRYYPGDPAIVAAGDEIVGRVENWGSYIQLGTNNIYFRAVESGGPDFGTASGAFNEGVVFIEQAAAYGSGAPALGYWLDRDVLPSATYVTGHPVTTNWPGGHLPAFVSHYPWLLSSTMRDDPAWETHMRNLLVSHGAWTDDNGPQYMTVFSAGTTAPQWGGYHADSLSDHPGDLTTFPSLMAFGALGDTAPSVGAYNAYRRGARETFATGASILFRRSDVDRSYNPPDAGLPDVVIGAIGLAELIEPGSLSSVLPVPYRPACPADYAGPDGTLDFFDLSAFLSAFNDRDPSADIAPSFGTFDFFDLSLYLSRFGEGCP